MDIITSERPVLAVLNAADGRHSAMYQGLEPRGIYDRYEKINELLHRAAVTAEPLELPLVRLKLVRIGFLGIFPNQTYSWH